MTEEAFSICCQSEIKPLAHKSLVDDINYSCHVQSPRLIPGVSRVNEQISSGTPKLIAMHCYEQPGFREHQ